MREYVRRILDSSRIYKCMYSVGICSVLDVIIGVAFLVPIEEVMMAFSECTPYRRTLFYASSMRMLIYDIAHIYKQ